MQADAKQTETKDALEELRMKFVHTRGADTDPTTTENDKGDDFLASLKNKYAHQPTFLQAVEEMTESLAPLFADEVNGEFYKRAFLVMTEPERTISFRVNWTDDKGRIQTNRGWRVEFSRCVTHIPAVSMLILMRVWLTVIFLPLPAHLDLTKGDLGSILL